MRTGAEWPRNGQGMYNRVRAPTVTIGVDRLRDQLQQAQAGLQKDGRPGKGAGDKGDTEKVLAQIEGMRNRMQQLAQAQNNQGKRGNGGRQPGDQSGQSQQGQQ